MNKSFRILMVLHMPWNPNLGGPKPQIELAKEFSRLGHTVEKFDYYDAFPELQSSPPSLSWIRKIFDPRFSMHSFSIRAKNFIQKNNHNFDIIDSHHGNLPFSKEELRFSGLVVARTAGLYIFYRQFNELVQENWNLPGNKNVFRRFFRLWRKFQQNSEDQNYVASLQKADSIILLNSDELAYVNNVLNLGSKCVVLPNGLTQHQHLTFQQSSQSTECRLKNKQIVFVGSWDRRKGSRDWPEITRMVRQVIPDACFLFLGTGLSVEEILNDLNLSACDWLKIIPSYQNIELPILLGNATVGAFPSYIEGFPIAVLEQLSSGLPVVAYDVPGSRAMLNCIDTSLMVPAGDIEQFSQKIIELISLGKTSYTKLSEQCIEVAQKFEWQKIAKETLDTYNIFWSYKNDNN
jgi:glycosyltransferase involved in cell wall biosynthesis